MNDSNPLIDQELEDFNLLQLLEEIESSDELPPMFVTGWLDNLESLGGDRDESPQNYQ